MPLIVDAFNVLHAWRTGPARNTLSDLQALGALTRRPPFAREPAVLVCDGPSPDPDHPTLDLGDGVEARFAGPGKDADSVIEGMIAASTAPARLIVVSSDRRIEKAARRRGCQTVPSEVFIGIVLRSDRGHRAPDDLPPELDHEETAEWMRHFGMPVPDAPTPSPKPPTRRANTDRAPEPPLPSSIDPAELDMERWLRDYPPPSPGMDRRPGSD